MLRNRFMLPYIHCQKDGCWWLGAYLAPGHMQLSWCFMSVDDFRTALFSYSVAGLNCIFTWVQSYPKVFKMLKSFTRDVVTIILIWSLFLQSILHRFVEIASEAHGWPECLQGSIMDHFGWYFVSRVTERGQSLHSLGFKCSWLSGTIQCKCICIVGARVFNSSLPGQNGRNFTDDTFKRICMNENFLYFDSNFIEVCSQGSDLQ